MVAAWRSLLFPVFRSIKRVRIFPPIPPGRTATFTVNTIPRISWLASTREGALGVGTVCIRMTVMLSCYTFVWKSISRSYFKNMNASTEINYYSFLNNILFLFLVIETQSAEKVCPCFDVHINRKELIRGFSWELWRLSIIPCNMFAFNCVLNRCKSYTSCIEALSKHHKWRRRWRDTNNRRRKSLRSKG